MKGSIEVPVNREIRNYKEKIFYGFTLKQVICGILGLTAGAVLYIYVLPQDWNSTIKTILCLIVSMPLFCIGFLKFNNMTATQLAKAIWIYYVKTPHRLPSRPSNRYAEIFGIRKSNVKPVKKSKTNSLKGPK